MRLILVDDTKLEVKGKIVKIARVYDEEWTERDALGDPRILIRSIGKSNNNIDIFSFSQKLPDTAPQYDYYMEWDNLAVVSLKTFEEWWAGLPQATRKNVRRSAKRGVEVKPAQFDDDLVKGIVNIYNETPVRQGRRFWHYGKDFETVKRENSSYLANCDFIGAYYNEELIGFIKIVYVGREAKIMQIVSMVKHQDKRPTNALLAKAVEICEKRQMNYFVYGKYIYGNRTNTPIIEFKNRNGFEMVKIPKYYVPMTLKGKALLMLNLHHGIVGLIPGKVNDYLFDLRTKCYERNDGERSETAEKNTN